MSFLTKEQILAVKDLRIEPVDVPEWGEGVQQNVSEMTANARDEFEQYMSEITGIGASEQDKKQVKKKSQYPRIRAMLCSLCMVDENGERMFTLQEAEKLGEKSARALDRIFDKANELNKVFGNQREQAEKNSEVTPDEENGG